MKITVFNYDLVLTVRILSFFMLDHDVVFSKVLFSIYGRGVGLTEAQTTKPTLSHGICYYLLWREPRAADPAC